MSIVLISPFSQRLRNGAQNPKNYPYWQEVITKLRKLPEVTEIWQIGVGNEYRFEGATHKFNLSLALVEQMAHQADVWISVDNFLPHLCNAQGVKGKGIVLFSRSDPAHFGYPQNANLLKDRKYLRPDQFMIWELCDYDENAYVSADTVVNAVISALKPVIKPFYTGTTA
jgi:hypothetical protein